MPKETRIQAAERRRAFAESKEGARLIDAYRFVPETIKPRLLEMMDSFRRWNDG